jgi:hypothetical protein
VRALVVYESMYGNTAKVAAAIAEGMGDAVVIEVGAAPAFLPTEVEIVVVGGPTHAHGMSHTGSRKDAAERVTRPVISRGPGIREWIAGLRVAKPTLAASFDTRANGPEILTGSAAKGAAKALQGRGCRLAAPPASFVLDGLKGKPYDRVAEAELERAREWGRSLARMLPIAVP